ncbi:MAG: hypothetical protein M1839_003236 [Geoglossum umbratile]|nr:MAG: hypothetical protein M1839_003236 [Geoglossum umbratile]
MGTRHLICVFYRGRFVVAQYGQWDGDPEGQGVTLTKFLRVPINIRHLKDGLEYIYEPTEEELIKAKEHIDELEGAEKDAWVEFVTNSNSELTPQIIDEFYPSLSRDTGARILEVITCAKAERKAPIELELSFANDWIYCEWAYVVDLDTEVLEVFSGSEQKKPSHRFGDVGNDNDRVPAFVSSIKFSELQNMESEQEFLDRVGKNDRDEEGVGSGYEDEPDEDDGDGNMEDLQTT